MEIRLTVMVDLINITAIGSVCGGKILVSKLEFTMANNPAITTFVNTVNSNFSRVKAGILALDAQINAFNNSPGTLSPEDQAALDGIVTASGELADAANAPVVPPPPVVG